MTLETLQDRSPADPDEPIVVTVRKGSEAWVLNGESCAALVVERVEATGRPRVVGVNLMNDRTCRMMCHSMVDLAFEEGHLVAILSAVLVNHPEFLGELRALADVATLVFPPNPQGGEDGSTD